MYFAKNLRFLRRRAELSQAELGDKLTTDYNTISRYENGKSTPKLEALTKLAQVFGVSIEALRNEDLTHQMASPSPPGLSATQTEAKRLTELSTRPVKHPLLVSVELDGTAASLERAVTRLTAINEVVADTSW
jgi:transcriptional regulator with XRE-family HTH domain